MKPSGDYQATPLSDERLGRRDPAPISTQTPSRAPTEGLPPIAERTGIVLVHGIGTQGPADTFLEWSAAIVELLTEWRLARDGELPPPAADNRVLDPVYRAAFSFNAASPPYLEITIPAAGAGASRQPESTWVITEAWWAAAIRPPDLGRVVSYLGRRLGTIASGIATGYRERAPLLRGMAIGEQPASLSWRLIERLDWAQARAFGSRPVAALIAGIGALALGGYGLLHRLPFGPIKDFAARRMIDSFLVEWFGDLPILLDDPIQAANVRARLAESIQRLEDDGCDAIVLIAHSGGALVTFETLLDPAYRHLRVDKLITLGQALGLAWRLAADPKVQTITPSHRLVGNLAKVRPGLRWVDVWASYDPAPAGPMPARGGLVATPAEPIAGAEPVKAGGAAVVETGLGTAPWLIRKDANADPETVRQVTASRTDASDPHIEVESRPVTNLMNVLNDHGSYWTNPEGFLVPLVRHIDAARGEAKASRFFVEKEDRTRRIVWRRQRVSVLAAWGWLCALTGAGLLAALTALTIAGDHRLGPTGDRLTAAWSVVPGHELVSGPVDAFRAVLDGLMSAVGLGGLAASVAEAGPGLLGAAFLLATLFALVKVGTWRWGDWDRRERHAMLPEVPTLPDRSTAAAQSIALLGGLAGFALATIGLGGAAVVAIGAAWLAGLVVWLAHPFRARPGP